MKKHILFTTIAIFCSAVLLMLNAQVAVKGDALPAAFKHILSLRKQNEADRFSTIKAAPAVAQDEITFWGRQMAEHALFLHLGLQPDQFNQQLNIQQLKDQGLALHKTLTAFLEKFKQNPEIASEILPLLQDLRTYKLAVINATNSGVWVGWVFPTLARHVLIELDYFVDKLADLPYTDQDEVAFWNVMNGEHAGLAAHLLDPSEVDLTKKAEKIADQYQNMKTVESEKEMMVQLSIKYAKELDNYNTQARAGSKAGDIKSIIHPVLLDHVIREGKRSIAVLNTLKNKAGAVYPQEGIYRDFGVRI